MYQAMFERQVSSLSPFLRSGPSAEVRETDPKLELTVSSPFLPAA